MRVLALDLSKNSTGWAVDGETVCPPKTGTWRAPSSEPGRIGLAFQSWLFEACKTWEVELLAYEAPAMGGRSKGFVMNAETSLVLIGLAFTVECIAAARGIPPQTAHVQSVRRHFVGQGRPDRPKEVVRERCRLLGWPVNNTDESDAAAVWAWAKAKHDPSFRLEAATPLFGRPAA